jgi:hypothetical protein
MLTACIWLISCLLLVKSVERYPLPLASYWLEGFASLSFLSETTDNIKQLLFALAVRKHSGAFKIK